MDRSDPFACRGILRSAARSRRASSGPRIRQHAAYYLEVAGPIVAISAPVGRALELGVAVTLARRAVVQWRHWLSILYIGADRRLGHAGELFFGSWLSREFRSKPDERYHGHPDCRARGDQRCGVHGEPVCVDSGGGVAPTLRVGSISYRLHGGGNIGLFDAGIGFIRVTAALYEPGVPIGLVVVDTPVKVQAGLIDTAPWTTYKNAIDDAARRGARIVVLPEKIGPLTPAEATLLRRALAAVAKSDQDLPASRGNHRRPGSQTESRVAVESLRSDGGRLFQTASGSGL
jgi:hypothetical protein